MEKVIIKIEGVVGEYSGSKEYLSYLIDSNKDNELTFEIGSLGGDFDTALHIYSKIRNHGKKTTAIYTAGMSASAATIIASACDVRIANENALGLIHKVLTPVTEYGYMNEDDIKQAIERLNKDLSDVEKMTVLLCNIYKQVMPKSSDDEIMELMKAESWLTAKEMMDFGLVTEIEYDVKKLDNSVKSEMRMKFAAMVKTNELPNLPKEFLNTKKDNMNLIENIANFFKGAFNLSDSDAKSQAANFATTFNDAIQSTFDAKLDSTVAKLDIVSRETFDTLQNRCDAMQNSLEALQNEKLSTKIEPVDNTKLQNDFATLQTNFATKITDLDEAKQSIATMQSNFASLVENFAAFKTMVGTAQIDEAKIKGENNGIASIETPAKKQNVLAGFEKLLKF
jgi:ATP-dependent protease ClpP protease subunit/BMFP domain-containing protein YqiC